MNDAPLVAVCWKPVALVGVTVERPKNAAYRPSKHLSFNGNRRSRSLEGLVCAAYLPVQHAADRVVVDVVDLGDPLEQWSGRVVVGADRV